MGRLFCCLAFTALLGACEPSTAGTNIAEKQPPTYASVRVFDFLDSTTDYATFLTVANELPVGFAPLAAPAVTDFQQVPVGTWTAYLSLNETTITTAPVQSPSEGQLLTLVEYTDDLLEPSLAWTVENYPTLAAGQAGVRFVLGCTFANSDQASLTGPDAPVVFTTDAVCGEMTGWIQTPPTPTALVLDSGSTTTFPIVTPAAGSLHTYAIAVQPSTGDLAALDITESPTGSGTASSPIAPTP